MRELSKTSIYVSSFVSQNSYGEQVGGYTNLRKVRANVQYMSNDIEYQTYGEITNSTITIRTEFAPNINKGDYVYLTQPTQIGTFIIGGATYNNYGQGEYIVDSVKTTYIGVNNVKNRTYITARKVKQ